jgi:carboxymethylenebutenolidase
MRRATLRLLATIFFILPLAANAQDWAKARLEASPRHREYVPIKRGDRTVQTFVVYPEVKDKVPVVILIHEIFGLSDWAKSMADDLAAAGFIVVAPDLLSGAGPNNGGTDSFAGQDAITKAVSGLDPDQVTADLDAVADFAKKIPAGNGKIATVGFCWGGGKSFAFATHRHDLSAAFVFYGPGPADVSTITAPIFGFYAGNDARIGATLPSTIAAMKAAGKRFEPVTYDGAGHGFMRAGVDPSNTVPGNKTAREEGFKRLVSLLKDLKTASIPTTSNKTLAKKSSTTKSTPSCHDTTKTAAM